jgi:hypothetical protein
VFIMTAIASIAQWAFFIRSCMQLVQTRQHTVWLLLLIASVCEEGSRCWLLSQTAQLGGTSLAQGLHPVHRGCILSAAVLPMQSI